MWSLLFCISRTSIFSACHRGAHRLPPPLQLGRGNGRLQPLAQLAHYDPHPGFRDIGWPALMSGPPGMLCDGLLLRKSRPPKSAHHPNGRPDCQLPPALLAPHGFHVGDRVCFHRCGHGWTEPGRGETHESRSGRPRPDGKRDRPAPGRARVRRRRLGPRRQGRSGSVGARRARRGECACGRGRVRDRDLDHHRGSRRAAGVHGFRWISIRGRRRENCSSR